MQLDVDWPNREASQLLTVGGIRWHVQAAGPQSAGSRSAAVCVAEPNPAVLLLHGTGASSHSYRDVFPELAKSLTVIAPDLPGHAHSRAPRSVPRTLPRMAQELARLLGVLDVEPRIIVGHSAGAAIGAQLVLDHFPKVHTLVSLNGAFLPFTGVARIVLPAMAKALALTPWPARRIARDAKRPRVVDRIVGGTGSFLDPRGRELYARLVQREDHVRGTVAMTAAWDLEPLAAALPRLPCALIAVAGSRDKTVPPERARRVAGSVRNGRFVDWPGLGHLAHEEDPARLVDLVVSVAKDCRAKNSTRPP
ncbi:MAG: alpha/beta fold hydrolase BchO [Myxococcota bacterium]